jgi:hypothetical protein
MTGVVITVDWILKDPFYLDYGLASSLIHHSLNEVSTP